MTDMTIGEFAERTRLSPKEALKDKDISSQRAAKIATTPNVPERRPGMGMGRMSPREEPRRSTRRPPAQTKRQPPRRTLRKHLSETDYRCPIRATVGLWM
jgi:hypothetical protein